MAVAILLGAFGAYCLRAARDSQNTLGAPWLHALLGYDQLKTRWATSVSSEAKLRGLGWLFFAFAARALWSAWQA